MWNEGDCGRGESGASVSAGQRQNMYFLPWTWATPKLTPVTRLEQTRVGTCYPSPSHVRRSAKRNVRRPRCLPVPSGRRRLSYQIIEAPTGYQIKKITSRIHIIESMLACSACSCHKNPRRGSFGVSSPPSFPWR